MLLKALRVRPEKLKQMCISGRLDVYIVVYSHNEIPHTILQRKSCIGSQWINLIKHERKKHIMEKYIQYDSIYVKFKTVENLNTILFRDANINGKIINKKIGLFNSKGSKLAIYEEKGDIYNWEKTGVIKILVISGLFVNLGGNYKVLICYY